MTAVGLFAGRGDVILAMGLALLVGCWIGWRIRGGFERFRRRRAAPTTP